MLLKIQSLSDDLFRLNVNASIQWPNTSTRSLFFITSRTRPKMFFSFFFPFFPYSDPKNHQTIILIATKLPTMWQTLQYHLALKFHFSIYCSNFTSHCSLKHSLALKFESNITPWLRAIYLLLFASTFQSGLCFEVMAEQFISTGRRAFKMLVTDVDVRCVLKLCDIHSKQIMHIYFFQQLSRVLGISIQFYITKRSNG